MKGKGFDFLKAGEFLVGPQKQLKDFESTSNRGIN
jgi:hypothetical protein